MKKSQIYTQFEKVKVLSKLYKDEKREFDEMLFEYYGKVYYGDSYNIVSEVLCTGFGEISFYAFDKIMKELNNDTQDNARLIAAAPDMLKSLIILYQKTHSIEAGLAIESATGQSIAEIMEDKG